MHDIYGLTFSLPETIGVGLYKANYNSCIYVCASQEPLYDLNEIIWFQEFNALEPENNISIGERTDGFYVIDFKSENVSFLINPDGSNIHYCTSDKSTQSNLRHLLLYHVIPMVMNKLGTEVLHASSILNQNSAIAFVGKSGFGKSTIAASLLHKGYALLSDDAVPIIIENQNVFTVNGPPEINAWPRARDLFQLGNIDKTNERKIPILLNDKWHQQGKFPLTQIYFLQPSVDASTIKINPISDKEALIELLKQVYRLDIKDNIMLEHQFLTLQMVAQKVVSKTITYPEGIPNIGELNRVLLNDLKAKKETILAL